MKPNVLLAGGSGYIGKNISSAIENDANLFALSKYPNTKKEVNRNITWLKKIFIIMKMLNQQCQV